MSCNSDDITSNARRLEASEAWLGLSLLRLDGVLGLLWCMKQAVCGDGHAGWLA